MARNPELSRSINQFTKIDGQITKRPSKHTKRAKMLGHVESPRGQKSADIKNGQRQGATKPETSQRQHLAEELALTLDPVKEMTPFQPSQPGRVIVYEDRSVAERSGHFVGLSQQLFPQETEPKNPDHETVDPESLGGFIEVWSLESLRDHTPQKFSGENEGWEDYASTAIDLRS